MRLLLILFTINLLACTAPPKKTLSPADKVINDAIKTHGGSAYEQAYYAFDFRDKKYTFKNEGGRYEYTMNQSKNDRDVYYFLSNDKFIRSINDEVSNLSEKDVIRYGNTLNSVIYFALLPYRLNDPAVIKTLKGTATIKGKQYHAIEVRFTEENGGTDHDDIFYYWINKQTKTMDYLAYEFHVNGGGVRFRVAYNARTVDGIRFQDYENFSAPKETALTELPAMYEAGELKLLSKIELENIAKVELMD